MSIQPETEREERIKLIHQQFSTLMWLGFKQVVSRLQKYGLTQPQFITLSALVHHNSPATMQQLTKVTFQDAPTMTGIVNRLLKMELVRRTRSEMDRRVVFVEATSAGVELVETIDRELRRDKRVGLFQLSETDLDKLEEMLDYLLLVLLRQNPEYNEVSLDLAKKWLQNFAADPLGMIKQDEIPSIL